ncbi:MAG: hypothetical protein RDV48_01420 [Candidatus Eremiobacteraeota bacterium]|nr:hypothetical protein [Candidatus Eremiobacteraeota bacterium]
MRMTREQIQNRIRVFMEKMAKVREKREVRTAHGKYRIRRTTLRRYV